MNNHRIHLRLKYILFRIKSNILVTRFEKKRIFGKKDHIRNVHNRKHRQSINRLLFFFAVEKNTRFECFRMIRMFFFPLAELKFEFNENLRTKTNRRNYLFFKKVLI